MPHIEQPELQRLAVHQRADLRALERRDPAQSFQLTHDILDLFRRNGDTAITFTIHVHFSHHGHFQICRNNPQCVSFQTE